MATVLVVDDHISVNKSICRVLAAEGHDTLSAFNGADALTLLSTSRPDLVILDLSLSSPNGIEVLKAVRANPKTAALPVVIFSGVADPAARHNALEHGASDYWVKAEIDPARISQMIRAMVGENRGVQTDDNS